MATAEPAKNNFFLSTFYSASAKAWSRFYDEAQEVLGGTA